MKKFIQTFKNIWSIDDLRSKITVTILLILIYRFGSHVALPGIDPNKFDLQSAKKGLLGSVSYNHLTPTTKKEV